MKIAMNFASINYIFGTLQKEEEEKERERVACKVHERNMRFMQKERGACTMSQSDGRWTKRTSHQLQSLLVLATGD